MATLPAQDLSVDLRAVTVRPTWGRAGAPALGPAGGGAPLPTVSRRRSGKGLRHVAVHGETWLALIGWQRPARSSWPHAIARIGWPAEPAVPAPASDRQQLALCHPDAWPGAQTWPRTVLGLSPLRRLSQDIQATTCIGHIPSFWPRRSWMPRALSKDLPYRASNWRLAGADPRLCPRARRLGALAPPRPAQGDLRLRTDRRRRRDAEPDRGAGTLER